MLVPRLRLPGRYLLMIEHSISPLDDGICLQRRGWQLGWVCQNARPPMPDEQSISEAWHSDQAIMLPGLIDCSAVDDEIRKAHTLMEQTLAGEDVADLLEAPAYRQQLQSFPLVSVSGEEHDEQAIEKLYFDVEKDGELLAEALWCKASWLSFHDEDASLRFRFSFGMEGFEDVAADPERQQWAGALCDAVFPESRALTENTSLLPHLRHLLDAEPAFVERIVYFNAPNGGAQMHHDVERGHAGVVYAQLSGATFWLALAKPRLMDELAAFVSDASNQDALAELLPKQADRDQLAELVHKREDLAAYMEEPDHELVEAVMDRSPAFIGYLVERSYAHLLEAGDVLLMPQRDLESCVWHCVICVGDEPGEGLSFAVRPA